MSKIISYTQKEIQSLLLPILREKGVLFQKNKNIFARKGIQGEQIITKTKDGVETINKVNDSSSFIVKNQTGAEEEYIVTGKKFKERYMLLKEATNGFWEYQSKGKVMAIKLTKKLWTFLQFPPQQLYFEASWGAAMVLKKHDYMVCPPDFSEIYRIARREFWQTYKIN